MEQKVMDETVMVQYLLGLLSDDERARLEETFFANDDYFDRLTTVEDDLIDEYIYDRLPANLRIAFEAKLKSSPSWAPRVAFARALSQQAAAAKSHSAVPVVPAGSAAASGPAKASPSFWQLVTAAFRAQTAGFRVALAAGMAGALAVFFVMAWQIAQQSQTVEGLRAERRSLDDAVGRMKNDIATLQATVQKKDQDLAQQLEQERLDRQNLEKQRAQNAGPLGLIASFVLRAGSVRGANDQPARLLIPRSAQSVRLQLDLETPREYRSYRADLRTAAGASVWAGDMLRPKTTDSGEAVVAELPADILAPGNYELALLGMAGGGKLEEVSYYYFGVQQR